MAEAARGARPKRGQNVPSRILKSTKKASGKADESLPATEGPKRPTCAKRPSFRSQKQKTASETPTDVLPPTALEGHSGAPPGQEISTVQDKSQFERSLSKLNASMRDSFRKKDTLTSANAEDLAAMLESQTLLLTYASMKIEKNLARMEENSERNLLVLLKEQEKLQTDVYRKKRRLLKLKKEQQLTDALDKQIEALSPIVKEFGTFQEDYKHFATALDSTRHELPTKGIHMGENQSQFLADLQEKLTATENILKQNPHEHTEHNAKALEAVKELEAASLKLNEELPRTVASVLNLSADVSKEVSLQSQKTCEDTLGLEAVKPMYFP